MRPPKSTSILIVWKRCEYHFPANPIHPIMSKTRTSKTYNSLGFLGAQWSFELPSLGCGHFTAIHWRTAGNKGSDYLVATKRIPCARVLTYGYHLDYLHAAYQSVCVTPASPGRIHLRRASRSRVAQDFGDRQSERSPSHSRHPSCCSRCYSSSSAGRSSAPLVVNSAMDQTVDEFHYHRARFPGVVPGESTGPDPVGIPRAILIAASAAFMSASVPRTRVIRTLAAFALPP